MAIQAREILIPVLRKANSQADVLFCCVLDTSFTDADYCNFVVVSQLECLCSIKGIALLMDDPSEGPTKMSYCRKD